jgi:hypothetical protein
MSNTFIYALIDPNTGNIRYIGKSNNPVKRLSDHISGCKNSLTHKNNWINSLLKENKKPSLKIIDEVPINEWQMWEIFYIEKYRKEGFELTNLSDGGSGPTFQEYYDKAKTIEKMKIRHKLFPNYNRAGNNLKQPIDKDLLHQLYIVDNLSMPNISEKLQCSEKKVFDNLKDYSIKKDKIVWKNQCASNPKKVVLQYDLEGNLIREWNSLNSASKFYKNTNISSCCRGEAVTASGFIWRYKDEFIDIDLNKLNYQKRKVSQYDLQGNFIRSFDSIKEASSHGFSEGNIQDCCVGRLKSSKGFIWRYSEDLQPDVYNKKNVKSVLQFTISGEFIKEWNSIAMVSRELKIGGNSIVTCCKGKYKSAGGFIWKYKDNI